MSYSIYVFVLTLSVSHRLVYNFTAGEDLCTVASMEFIHFKVSQKCPFVALASFILGTNL